LSEKLKDAKKPSFSVNLFQRINHHGSPYQPVFTGNGQAKASIWAVTVPPGLTDLILYMRSQFRSDFVERRALRSTRGSLLETILASGISM
jgi:hypothetical protein